MDPEARESAPVNDTRPRRRRSIWLKVALALVIGIPVALFCFVFAVYVSLSGGLDDVFSRGGPVETDKQVVQARDRALPDLQVEVTALGSAVSPALTGGGDILGVATVSRCDVGQHNFKVDDSYDLSCEGTASDLRTMNVDTFRAQALAVDKVLQAQGWQPVDLSMTNLMTQYWDQRDSFVAVSNYRPVDLPELSYRNQAKPDLRLVVRFAGRPTAKELLRRTGSRFEPTWTAADKQRVPEVTLMQRIPTDKAGLQLELTRVYFQD